MCSGVESALALTMSVALPVSDSEAPSGVKEEEMVNVYSPSADGVQEKM